MSNKIKLLPDSVANLIAAGEVIEGPASVIKELVENAVDAGATDIQIILKDAGRTLIQVIDNGCGMNETDARLSFERHSTSKIRAAADLYDLRTMGFRGEALATIAASAQVELRTRRQEDELGTMIKISGSQCESQEPVSCPVGCNFMVSNLFFNVPARRKFLKSNQVELSNILREFERLALVNAGLNLSVTHNGKILHKLSAGNFKARICQLYGNSMQQQLGPINWETTMVKITGFIGLPENARKRNYLQFFFVNGRYMRHPYFHKAVVSCYDQLIPKEEQPNYFLNFEVSPDSIDVNIHPKKMEIKFENEVPIWQIISAAVKETLGKNSAVPSIDFDVTDAPELPPYVAGGGNFTKPEIDINKGYNPFDNSHRDNSFSQRYSPKVPSNWQDLYENFERENGDNAPLTPDTEGEQSHISSAPEEVISFPDDCKPMPSLCMQVAARYILTVTPSGLMLVDQHRAHIRITYERYMQRINGKSICSQQVLFPEILQLNAAQNAILVSLEPEMMKMGFNLSKLSGNDWAINGIPPEMEHMDVKQIITDVICDFVEGGYSITERVYEHIALLMAKSAAVSYGTPLSALEMETTLSELLALRDPKYTPDGKLVICMIENDYMKKLFA